jgi:hypothetical protein
MLSPPVTTGVVGKEGIAPLVLLDEVFTNLLTAGAAVLDIDVIGS